MWTIATILNVTSGFALMRYHGGPAEIIATSLIIDAALAPLTAVIASRRGRSPLVWAPLGFALGMWALVAMLLLRSRAQDSRPDPRPATPPTASNAA